MDYQQPHGYMRHPPPPPPPPPAADPFQRPPLPPPQSNHPWPYPPTQFQYHPQTQHSPSPPPPQWPPPPPQSSDHPQYAQHPYQTHQPPHYHAHPHYPPPPPLPPRPPHGSQSYPQDWGSGGWSHHQNWQYPTAANNNEEDWAARAKAWAAAKSASDNQHTPSHFGPGGRPEEQNHFHEKYPQQFLDGHVPVAPASNYHQFPVAMGSSNRTGVDVHAPFPARDGGTAGDSVPPFPPQEKSPISPLVHQQEVPSSYSSVAGNVEAGDRYEKLNSSSSTPVASFPPHHFHHMPPTTGRWMEEPHHVLNSQPTESVTDMSDQPLNFAPHYNRDPETHVQPNYAHSSSVSVRGGDPTVAMSSNYAWPPHTAPGAAYPPPPPAMPLGSQVDHPIAMPSAVSGHTAPVFPPGPGFQPIVPMVGSGVFGVGAGVTPHPTTFSGDAFGSADRPKKASVPNWLREEIIKNKAVITSSSSALNFPKEDSQSMDDDDNDKPSRKEDQSDNKSNDSSTEDEDEDEVEVARTAAINQEIKRVLTDVLLKVTDDLFDEIATKVLKEDGPSVEVNRDGDLSNHHFLPSAPSVSTPKASAKILIPTKAKGSDTEDGSERSTSGTAGDILGLGNYASDEEDEIQNPGKPNLKDGSMQQSKLLDANPVIENSGYQEQRNVPASAAEILPNDNMAAKEYASANSLHSCKRLSGTVESEYQHGYDTSNSNNYLTEKAVERDERPDGNFEAQRWMNNDSRTQNTRSGSDKNDELENKRSSMKKEQKNSESSKGRLDKKGDEEHRRHEERRARAGRNDHHDNFKDKVKEKGKTDEKAISNEPRKRPSSSDNKEGTIEAHKDKRSSSKKDDDGKRKERTGDERKERSRHKSGTEPSRHKRRQSSSVGARDRGTKDNSLDSRANESSDESSDDSRRKSHHLRRHKSPLPTRTRKRQVSRSPHSKHSKRRNSPYSSIESTRGKRSPSPSPSRSRSPVHRRR
ncbi:C-type lectin domain-containing protein 180-like isoform X1 [Salvia splendens]|uniref:C-type lectin domain-containing protein 180-like isoform X1 n=1 Tax=Salvia splendens TaxID=180675 RepID=UPI001C26967B|nr:C-type lectin domain-containing protein 180-like isoform X1 [Salvia splendens]